MIVVINSTSLSSQTDPCACMTSRIPPCSMMTANAIVAPTRNHQRKTLRVETMTGSQFQATIQAAVLDRFGNMHGIETIGTGKIRNRPGNPKNASMRTGRQSQLRHGLFQ